MRNNKKRAGAYFGLHFDFHAHENAVEIGSMTKAENIAKYLDEVKPDYIQVDTKGHYGLASFDSEYGDVAPGLSVDHLKIIREETEKRGIALIAHHSSSDAKICKTHPEWANLHRNGELSEERIDITSEYVDKKFIFQLKELCGRYGFDGVWVDGDCWCLEENYRPEFVEAFLKESGYTQIDEEPDSPSRLAFRKFHKETFLKYLNHYIEEIKKDYPDFEITSNTAFSNFHPEKPVDAVDFLSADVYNLQYRTFARCYASHNKPWDIMGWGFPLAYPGKCGAFCCSACNVHLDRITRMAGQIISLGGGFQVVNSMTSQGEIRLYEMENMKKLGEFMAERKQFNFQSIPVKTTAILLSTENRERLINEGDICVPADVDFGLCDTVIDSGRPCDIIFDYHVLEDLLLPYTTIIVPETKYMSAAVKNKLLEYANKGGSLVINGANSCKIFREALNGDIVDFKGEVLYAEQKSNPNYASGITVAVMFENLKDEEICNCFIDKMDHSAPKVASTALTNYGKGKIAFAGWDIIGEYRRSRRFVLRDIMGDILNAVDDEPFVYLKSGTKRVEIIPATKDDMLLINLVNTNEYYYYNWHESYGEIPSVYEIEIAIKCDKAPKEVMLEPQHIVPQYDYDGKYLNVKVNKLDIHSIITIK